jgi:hypothetical protein
LREEHESRGIMPILAPEHDIYHPHLNRRKRPLKELEDIEINARVPPAHRQTHNNLNVAVQIPAAAPRFVPIPVQDAAAANESHRNPPPVSQQTRPRKLSFSGVLIAPVDFVLGAQSIAPRGQPLPMARTAIENLHNVSVRDKTIRDLHEQAQNVLGRQHPAPIPPRTTSQPVIGSSGGSIGASFSPPTNEMARLSISGSGNPTDVRAIRKASSFAGSVNSTSLQICESDSDDGGYVPRRSASNLPPQPSISFFDVDEEPEFIKSIKKAKANFQKAAKNGESSTAISRLEEGISPMDLGKTAGITTSITTANSIYNR